MEGTKKMLFKKTAKIKETMDRVVVVIVAHRGSLHRLNRASLQSLSPEDSRRGEQHQHDDNNTELIFQTKSTGDDKYIQGR